MAAAWELVPCLVTLREEFNKIAPKRSKTSDGSIGNLVHSEGNSDHNPDETGRTHDEDSDNLNEVHGIDVDKDLNSDDFDMGDVIHYMVNECRKPNTVGKDKGRLQTIIYNRKIYEAYDGWKEREYRGDNPHTEHAHFSAEYTKDPGGLSSDTSSWGLVERFSDDMGHVESFSTNAIQQLTKAATAGVLGYGNKGEGGVPNIPFDDKDNVLDVIAATYKICVSLNENVLTLTNRVAYLEGRITEITGSAPNPPAAINPGKITK